MPRRAKYRFPPAPEAYTSNGYPLLEFDRKPIDKHLLRGFLLTWSVDLTILHLIDDVQYQLNGYAIFRNKDVKRWRGVTPDEFSARAAAIHKLRPTAPKGVSITSLQDALSSAGKAFPLITLRQERIAPGVCVVGKVSKLKARSVVLFHISPQAEWDQDEKHRLRDITKIDFGGAYETLLHKMSTPTESVRSS